MATTINLGDLVTIGGKVRSTGASSGLDVKGIVDSLVSVKETERKKVTDNIALNSGKITAISEYRTLLAKIQTATGFLKNPPGVDNAAKNIFEYRRISATSSNGSAASNYMAVSSSAGATLGSYDIAIDNLAVAKNNSSIAFSSKTAALATTTGAGGTPKAGTFSLGGQNITIAVGDSLAAIAAKINGTTTNSNVRADIIRVSDSDFRLKISATSTGTANAYAVGGDMTVFNSMFSGGASSSVAAEDAQITIDGALTVTRSTNTISDAIEGVTFTLYQETPTNTVRVDVLSDPTTVQAKIEEFVQTYNDAKTFIAKQQQRDEDGKLLDTAKLGESDVLNSFINNITQELSLAVSGLSGSIRSLSDIGINFIDYAGDSENPAVTNLLQIDTAKLQSKIDGDFEGVRSLFEFQMSSSSPDRLRSFERTNAISVSGFTLDVDFSRAEGEQVQLQYTDTNGVVQTLDATYEFQDPVTVTSGPVSSGIFGATTTGGTFTGLANNDSFRITLNKADGTSSNFDFVFKTTPVAANEFSDMTELATAIAASTGIAASVDSSGKLNITPDAQFDTLSFTNLGAKDFITAFGFSNTEPPAGTISGPVGSVLEGLSLIYAPAGPTDSITVTFTQGIGDRVDNEMTRFLEEETGLLDQEVANIKDESDDLKVESTEMQEKIDSYRDKLYDQYAGLEAAISRVNSLLLLLDAQDKARQNN